MQILLSGTPPYGQLSNTVTLLFLAWQNGHTFSNEKTLLTQSPVDVGNGHILKSQTVASFTIKYFTPLKRLLARNLKIEMPVTCQFH